MPPSVYILCGLPFAGKTTLARTLAARLGWTHLEVDALNQARGLGLNGEQLTRQEWIAAYRAAYQRLDERLRMGQTVLYDATNYRRAQRERARQIAARHSAATFVIHVTTPAAAVQHRRERNRLRPERPDVHDLDLAAVSAQFEPPTPDEHVLRYNGSEPIASWITGTLLKSAADEKL